MGKIMAAMASSHAFTFLQPELWDKRREHTRASYKRRYDVEPPEQAQVYEETLDANQARYKRIRDGLISLRHQLNFLRPDVLIVIGDDQDENFREDNLPQFAIYIGSEVVAADREGNRGRRYHCDEEVAWAILEQCVEGGLDLAYSKSFPREELISHAHREPLEFLDVDGAVSIVPIFINAIHIPAPTPARCYQFGQTLRQVIESLPANKRVVLYASGGLSHFTAGYPWPYYKGPYSLGAISQDFDRRLINLMLRGHLDELAKLTSRDLLDNGDIELRQWIMMLGAISNHKPQQLAYEPFYRGVLGMAVGYWDLEAT